MSYEELLKIRKPFFTVEDIGHVLGLRPDSALVLCSRYVRKGLLVRLKRGVYAKPEQLANLGQLELFRLANFLQVPSYISLMTALSYYGLTTQVQRGFFESICIKRTRAFEVGELTFRYVRVRSELYGGYEKRDDVFIALPEKALLDSCYLASIGRYSLDANSLDLTRARPEVLADLSRSFPSKTSEYLERLRGKISGT